MGIENIKEALTEVLEFTEDLSEVVSDGKVTFNEWPTLFKALTGIPAIVSKAKAALPELKDLSAEEALDVSEYIADIFDIPSDDLEAKIEGAIELLADTYAALQDIPALVFKWGNYINGLKAA